MMVTGNADVTPSAAAILHLYTAVGTKILIAVRTHGNPVAAASFDAAHSIVARNADVRQVASTLPPLFILCFPVAVATRIPALHALSLDIANARTRLVSVC